VGAPRPRPSAPFLELELEVNQLEVIRLSYKCEDCVERDRTYKELDDLNNQERYERMQEDIEQSKRQADNRP
jgi:hypothetical protein